MTEQSNEARIRAAFEAALIAGLKGTPLTTKEGELVTDPVTGEMLLDSPEASFLSVVRSYLKDLEGDGKPKVPKTGQPREGGILADYMKTAGKGLPFGRPQ